MESRNKKVQVIVNSEKLPATPVQESSHRNHHVAIPIEELGATLKIVKDVNLATDAKDNVPEEEENKEGDDVCRFCLQEGSVKEKLEDPCSCIGSIKYAHRKCVAEWCNAKRDTTCEICKKTYMPNYSVTTPPPYDDVVIYMSERWRIPFTETRILTPLQLIERGINRLLRSMNVKFSLTNPTFGVLFGTTLLLFLAVLVIRDAYNYDSSKDDKLTHFLYCVMVFIAIPICFLTLIVECRDQRDQREREREREREIQAQWRGQE